MYTLGYKLWWKKFLRERVEKIASDLFWSKICSSEKTRKENEKKYTDRQIINLKQFYQNIKNRNRLPRKNECLGWTIEYLIDEKYDKAIISQQTCENSFLSEKITLTHNFYPIVNQVTWISENIDLIVELNKNVGFYRVKKDQTYFHKVYQFIWWNFCLFLLMPNF